MRLFADKALAKTAEPRYITTRFFAHARKIITAAELLDQIPKNLPAHKKLLAHDPKTPDPATHKYDPLDYYQTMPNPFVGPRQPGIEALRAVGKFFTVFDHLNPTTAEQAAAIEYACGTPAVFADMQQHKELQHRAGVALHPGNAGKTGCLWRGDVNPDLGHGLLHATLDKWEEYRLAEKFAPGTMKPLSLLSDLSFYQSESFETQRQKLCKTVEKQRPHLTTHTQKAINLFVAKLFKALLKQYPQGIHIKHILGCYTADAGMIITTTSSQPESLTRVFIDEIKKKTRNTSEATVRQHLLNQLSSAAIIVYDLLFHPEKVIISPEFKIQKTAQGFPLEFRVEVINGEACAVWPRHTTYEYYPRFAAIAVKFVNDFFKHLPPTHRILSCGMDIGFYEDKPFIIDGNFGSESGFRTLGVKENVVVSNLQGKPTSLISTLQQAARLPPRELTRFLLGLNDTILAHPQIEAGSEDVAVFIRDRQLDLWCAQNGGSRSAIELMKRLRKTMTPALKEIGFSPEMLIQSTEAYFDRCGVSTKCIKQHDGFVQPALHM